MSSVGDFISGVTLFKSTLIHFISVNNENTQCHLQYLHCFHYFLNMSFILSLIKKMILSTRCAIDLQNKVLVDTEHKFI